MAEDAYRRCGQYATHDERGRSDILATRATTECHCSDLPK